MLKLYLDIIMGRQLDRLMPFWQLANILHSVLIFVLLWQINIVVVAPAAPPPRKCKRLFTTFWSAQKELKSLSPADMFYGFDITGSFVMYTEPPLAG